MLVIYKFLQGRNDRIIIDMEEDALGLVDLLVEGQRTEPKSGVLPGSEPPPNASEARV